MFVSFSLKCPPPWRLIPFPLLEDHEIRVIGEETKEDRSSETLVSFPSISGIRGDGTREGRVADLASPYWVATARAERGEGLTEESEHTSGGNGKMRCCFRCVLTSLPVSFYPEREREREREKRGVCGHLSMSEFFKSAARAPRRRSLNRLPASACLSALSSKTEGESVCNLHRHK